MLKIDRFLAVVVVVIVSPLSVFICSIFIALIVRKFNIFFIVVVVVAADVVVVVIE